MSYAASPAAFPHVTTMTALLTRTKNHEADFPTPQPTWKIIRLDLENPQGFKTLYVSCFHRWVSFKQHSLVTRKRNLVLFCFFLRKEEKKFLNCWIITGLQELGLWRTHRKRVWAEGELQRACCVMEQCCGSLITLRIEDNNKQTKKKSTPNAHIPQQ